MSTLPWLSRRYGRRWGEKNIRVLELNKDDSESNESTVIESSETEDHVEFEINEEESTITSELEKNVVDLTEDNKMIDLTQDKEIVSEFVDTNNLVPGLRNDHRDNSNGLSENDSSDKEIMNNDYNHLGLEAPSYVNV